MGKIQTKLKQKELIYTGQIISLNDVKSFGWQKYKKLKDKIQLEMLVICKNAYLPKMQRIELVVKYRSRHDVDNLSYNSKIFVDTLVKLGKLKNDTKEYYNKVCFEYDKELKNNTIKFIINYA